MDFIKRTAWIAGASLALTACATNPPPEYSKTHPANPEAPAASVPSAPNALATYRSFGDGNKRVGDAPTSPSPDQATTESGHEHHH